MEYANSLLNLAWVAVCIATFTWFLVSTSRRRVCSRRLLMGRVLALSLALVSLFPCVSASDDSIRLIALNGQIYQDAPDQWAAGDRHVTPETAGILGGMLEDLEAAQVTAVVVVTIALSIFAMCFVVRASRSQTFLPSCPGRAPPSCLPAAI